MDEVGVMYMFRREPRKTIPRRVENLIKALEQNGWEVYRRGPGEAVIFNEHRLSGYMGGVLVNAYSRDTRLNDFLRKYNETEGRE